MSIIGGALYFISGVGALVFGKTYNKLYKQHQRTKSEEYWISKEPRDREPNSTTYHCLENYDEYSNKRGDWEKYNAIRRYYVNTIEIEKQILGVESEWKLEYDFNTTKTHKVLDERFKWIYDDMDKNGVSIEYRPGVDYVNWVYLAHLEKFQGRIPRWIKWPDIYKNDSQYGYKLYLDKKALNNIHMDYSSFYSDKYK